MDALRALATTELRIRRGVLVCWLFGAHDPRGCAHLHYLHDVLVHGEDVRLRTVAAAAMAVAAMAVAAVAVAVAVAVAAVAVAAMVVPMLLQWLQW